MRRRRRGLSLGPATCVGLLLACGLAGEATAYVRYRTKPPADGGLGQPYAWGVASVDVVGYPSGLPNMTSDQISNAMSAAVAAWDKTDSTNATCSYLKLNFAPAAATAIPPAAARDHLNQIAIRTGVWTDICSRLNDGSDDCHQPGELALTTVWSRSCGEIVEADVEVNADVASPMQFMWADLDVNMTSGLHDLQNALTHEMGHFIGLDHTCALGPGASDGEVDDLGNPVPDCSDATIPEMQATMYPSSEAGDVTKRTLSPDDHAGLCSIYPLGTTPMSCGGQQSSGCAVADAGGHETSSPEHRHGQRWPVLLGFVAALGSAISLRSRRRR